MRKNHREKDGKRHAYWTLVESVRTERGPRQRIVAYLGLLDETGRLGVLDAGEPDTGKRQGDLFEPRVREWVEVDTAGLRVERPRFFGGPWLGRELLRMVGLDDFLREAVPVGREAGLERSRRLARLVRTERRLLSVTHQRLTIECRRTLAHLYSAY